jgi:hypothetical protein
MSYLSILFFIPVIKNVLYVINPEEGVKFLYQFLFFLH